MTDQTDPALTDQTDPALTDQTDPPRTRDFGFIAIIVLVVAVAVWLLLMPIFPAIASATLHRFHLAGDSFTLWAIQTPIPSMYNFENRFEVHEFPPGLVDPILIETEKRYINHYPARVFTFADNRYRYLVEGKDRWFTLESSYRGQTLKTRFHAKPINDEVFELIRLPLSEASP